MNTAVLHEQVWKRFIRMPYGHLLDYADESGGAIIPTAEELQAGLPNALVWCTPIENGAFFGGLYLYGLCEKYDFAPDETLKNEIKTIADGLFLLCDVCKQDGCIARGVADDGVSHPPFSSEDQFGPWMLGLWRLFRSPASDEAMRDGIKKRLVRSLGGVRKAGWKVPSEWEGVTQGSFDGKDWRGVSKLLFAAAVAREVGVVSEAEFELLAAERPSDAVYSRPEIVSHGFAPDLIRKPGAKFWISICAQICVRELITLDAPRAEYYRAGLRANGVAVLEFLGDYEKYMEIAEKKFFYDWRLPLRDIRPWKNKEEAIAEANRHLGCFFGQEGAIMITEKKLIGEALFGCWIAVVSGDKTAADYAYKCLSDATERVDWVGCGYSWAFTAEAAIYCYQNLKKK